MPVGQGRQQILHLELLGQLEDLELADDLVVELVARVLRCDDRIL